MICILWVVYCRYSVRKFNNIWILAVWNEIDTIVPRCVGHGRSWLLGRNSTQYGSHATKTFTKLIIIHKQTSQHQTYHEPHTIKNITPASVRRLQETWILTTRAVLNTIGCITNGLQARRFLDFGVQLIYSHEHFLNLSGSLSTPIGSRRKYSRPPSIRRRVRVAKQSHGVLWNLLSRCRGVVTAGWERF